MANNTELDITEFFNNAAPMDYSASVAEIGNDAGPSTWQAAIEDSAEYSILDNDEKRELFRKFVRGFGAWDDSEIAAWTDVELNALCLQCISGDMREAGLHADMSDDEWTEYGENENTAGRIYGGILTTDGRVYFDIGG